MATIEYDLCDFAIADTGEVIVHYEYLVSRLMQDGKSLSGFKTFPLSQAEAIVNQNFSDLVGKYTPDVMLHNQRCSPDRIILVARIDGVPETPPPETFEWNIPEEYLTLDLVEYLVQALVRKFSGRVPNSYVERMMLELELMQYRGMMSVLRALVYIIDQFGKNNIVHGVGRGSACASLVLYLIGVHMVDPIEYDVPIEEFLRVQDPAINTPNNEG